MKKKTENRTIHIELYCRYKEKRVPLVELLNVLLKQNEEKDKEIERLNNIIKIMEKYFELIINLGYDYDVFNQVDSLKGLIDELVRYANLGRVYNTTEPISEGIEGKKYNIIGEELKGSDK